MVSKKSLTEADCSQIEGKKQGNVPLTGGLCKNLGKGHLPSRWSLRNGIVICCYSNMI